MKPQDLKGGSKVTPSLAPTFLEKLLKLDIHQVGTNGLNGITLCFSVPHVPVLSSVRNRSAHAPLLDAVVSCRIIIGCLAQMPIPYLIEFVRRGFLRLVAGCIEPMLPIKCLTYSTDYTYNCGKLIVCVP